MKKKSLLHVLLLVLACSAVCFAGCNMGSDPVSPSGSTGSNEPSGEHTHVYQKVDRVESTCVTHGTDEHYICTVEGCDKTFVYDVEEGHIETTLSMLQLPFGEHDFNGITVDGTDVKTTYTAFDDFDATDLKVTKTCSRCEGVLAEDSEISIEGGEGLTCDKTSVTVKVGDFTASLSVTVNKKVVELPTIASKPAAQGGATVTADVQDTALYTVEQNDGGNKKGTYNVVLKLVDSTNYVFDTTEGGDTVTLEFKILAGPNTVAITNETIASVGCHKEPALSVSVLDGATVSYVYCDTEDGEYAPIASFGDGLTAGTWYVKAVAAETEDYSETESAPASFVVEHKFAGYKVGKTEDTRICSCGADVEGAPFKTLSTSVNYVKADVSTFVTDMAKIKLEGVSAFTSQGALTYEGNELDVAAVASLIGGAHGEKTFQIEVTDADDYKHTLTVPVILVTDYIDSWEQLLYIAQMHNGQITAENVKRTVNDKTYFCKSEVGENGVYGKDKYYVLSEDIVGGVTNSFAYNGTTYGVKDYNDFGGYYKGNETNDNTENYDGIGDWQGYNHAVGGYASEYIKGFAGTIDGAGHLISGVKVGYMGMFSSLKGATVKNMVISVDSFNGNNGVLACQIAETTIDNVDIIIENPVTLSGAGVVFTQFAFNSTVKNVNVYAPGSTLSFLIAQGYYAAVSNNTYTNIHGYAKSIASLVQTTKDIETVTKVENIAEDQRKDQYLETTSESQDLVLPELFKDYTVTRVVLNDEIIAESSTLVPSDVLSLVNNKFGGYTALVTFAKEGHEITLPMDIAVVSEVINSWEQLLYRVGWIEGDKKGEGEYYILGGDIAGKDLNPGIDFTYNGTTYGHPNPVQGTGNTSNDTWTVAGGFAGTLDGAGYTISGLSLVSYSMFGTISGGTVKNLNLVGTMYDWGSWGIFGGSESMDRATIENVTVTLSGELDFIAGSNSSKNNARTGFFTGGQMTNCTIKNVTINAEGYKMQNIICSGDTGIRGSSQANYNTYSNVKIYVADYAGKAQYNANNGYGNMGWGTNGSNYGSVDIMVYTTRQKIVLEAGKTFELNLPTGIKNNPNYTVHRIGLNGDYAKSFGTAIDGKIKLKAGSDSYAAIDYTDISTDEVIALIGENYGDYDIVYSITDQTFVDSGWAYNSEANAITYGDHYYVARVTFEKPASTSTEDPAVTPAE